MSDYPVDKVLDERQKKLVKQLLEHFEAAKKKREEVEDVWQDIADLVIPRITQIKYSRAPKPTRYGEKMFTSEPVSALRLASDGTSGYMMPRTSMWVKMEPMNKKVYEIPGARKFYQESTEALHAELNRSNFYGEMTPVLDHGFSIGTSTLFVEEDTENESASIIAIDPSEMYIAENQFKRVDTFFRRTWMTGKRLLERFPSAITGKFEEDVKKNPYEMHEVLHCVYKRIDRIHERIDAENKPIASVYILVEKQHLLRESGFDFPHYVSWRHRRITGTPYGGSPSWDALVDIMRLNSHSMDMLDASHLAVRPPIAYPQEMAEIDISPNGMNPYRIPGRIPQRLDVLGVLPWGREQEEAISKAIRDHFQTDFFLLLTHSDRQKTAFEVSEMAGERAAVMSTVIGRIESELIDPTLEIIYRIAAEQGRMPEVPPALLESGEDTFKWEYIGPLAQLQKRHHGQQSRTHIFAEAAPIMEMFPETRDVIDSDKLMREILFEGGMNADIIRDEDIVADIRQMRAQMEQEQEEKAIAMEAMKHAPQGGMEQMMGGGASGYAKPSDL